MGSEFRSCSAGIDKEAIKYCKRRDTKDLVQNESAQIQTHRIQGVNLDATIYLLDVRKNHGFLLEANTASEPTKF